MHWDTPRIALAFGLVHNPVRFVNTPFRIKLKPKAILGVRQFKKCNRLVAQFMRDSSTIIRM